MKKLFKKCKKGFTLVELLVVIAILAILATVTVVGYVGFTDRAKNSNAETELHEVETTFNYYLTETSVEYSNHTYKVIFDVSTKTLTITEADSNEASSLTADVLAGILSVDNSDSESLYDKLVLSENKLSYEYDSSITVDSSVKVVYVDYQA